MKASREDSSPSSPRILYSFPYRIGAQRVCLTAWQQAVWVASAGAKVNVLCGSVSRSLGVDSCVHPTLSWGLVKLPFRVLGRYRTLQLHDWLTARWLDDHHASVDLFHGWPLASLRTMRVARRHGIPCLLERPNAHTEYAFQASADENRLLGLSPPAAHDHTFDRQVLDHEEREYAECDFLLCPSSFVARTFLERSTPASKILRHHYGFDDIRFFPGDQNPESCGLTAIYAGVCEPRKGLHYALEAWLASEAHVGGRFLICGTFVPGYAEKLGSLLSHPSVEVLGHRNDLPEIMRKSDLFILSSIEEGSALVTYEARGCGCVLLVSDASGAPCSHEINALVHPMRSVDCLTSHLNLVHRDRRVLSSLRMTSLIDLKMLTWQAAGITLLEVYRATLASVGASTQLDFPSVTQ